MEVVGRFHLADGIELRWSLASMTTPGFCVGPVGGAGFGPAGL